MNAQLTRRKFASSLALSLAGMPFVRSVCTLAEDFSDAEIAPFRTPHKYEKLVLAASNNSGAFDSKSVDDPFVFLHEGAIPITSRKYTRSSSTGARRVRSMRTTHTSRA